ncbi:DnaA inactivator Hda [Paraferrimonas haliotis]|uniref:DnaA regulatory inactivator Hda n=1 Tax=Paraferrimonas haliotis TaxID=2013866 RepID=A0AA37TTM9_9GAMM|nr:DnaA inactivator Hda [Paraferrimonas haliotis]GLS84267.1 DnaA regulatory inactivator Hda [Paraferrimonas haliotis]
MSNSSPIQLSLPVHLPDDETFASFHSVENDELIHQLRQMAMGLGEKNVYLWGEPNCGRTHLIHAACAAANDAQRRSFYVPLAIHSSLSPAVFEGLEQFDLVCLDDIHSICGNPLWEEAVFDLFNRIREQQATLLVSANCSAKALPLTLPDLMSRMQWGLSYQLHPLDDTQKLAALAARAEQRGLTLPDDVGRFLLNRLNRDMRTLFDVLDKLDKASMVHKRKLTIPFIKETLSL